MREPRELPLLKNRIRRALRARGLTGKPVCGWCAKEVQAPDWDKHRAHCPKRPPDAA